MVCSTAQQAQCAPFMDASSRAAQFLESKKVQVTVPSTPPPPCPLGRSKVLLKEGGPWQAAGISNLGPTAPMWRHRLQCCCCDIRIVAKPKWSPSNPQGIPLGYVARVQRPLDITEWVLRTCALRWNSATHGLQRCTEVRRKCSGCSPASADPQRHEDSHHDKLTHSHHIPCALQTQWSKNTMRISANEK